MKKLLQCCVVLKTQPLIIDDIVTAHTFTQQPHLKFNTNNDIIIIRREKVLRTLNSPFKSSCF